MCERECERERVCVCVCACICIVRIAPAMEGIKELVLLISIALLPVSTAVFFWFFCTLIRFLKEVFGN